MDLKRLFHAACCCLACAACSAPVNEYAKDAAITPGGLLFADHCAICHGNRGDLGLSGAKDLTASTLGRDGMMAVITHGKGAMAGFGKKLSPEQIGQVVDHVLSLQTPQ